mmetsp:Transcript_44322/g.135011  ORF Transcript_44322/g.135011 Transcript_44322/m.135011 type:complete len:264 (+) Transcript_44322:768-1559(+)
MNVVIGFELLPKGVGQLVIPPASGGVPRVDQREDRGVFVRCHGVLRTDFVRAPPLVGGTVASPPPPSTAALPHSPRPVAAAAIPHPPSGTLLLHVLPHVERTVVKGMIPHDLDGLLGLVGRFVLDDAAPLGLSRPGVDRYGRKDDLPRDLEVILQLPPIDVVRYALHEHPRPLKVLPERSVASASAGADPSPFFSPPFSPTEPAPPPSSALPPTPHSTFITLPPPSAIAAIVVAVSRGDVLIVGRAGFEALPRGGTDRPAPSS